MIGVKLEFDLIFTSDIMSNSVLFFPVIDITFIPICLALFTAFIMFLDSPSSTSELTFKIRANAGANGGTLHINRTGDSTDDTNRASYPSSITVMEILS